MAIIFLHYLWIGPVETIVLMYFMYTEVEISSVIGVAVLLLFIPLQGKKRPVAVDEEEKKAVKVREHLLVI